MGHINTALQNTTITYNSSEHCAVNEIIYFSLYSSLSHSIQEVYYNRCFMVLFGFHISSVARYECKVK